MSVKLTGIHFRQTGKFRQSHLKEKKRIIPLSFINRTVSYLKITLNLMKIRIVGINMKFISIIAQIRDSLQFIGSWKHEFAKRMLTNQLTPMVINCIHSSRERKLNVHR